MSKKVKFIVKFIVALVLISYFIFISDLNVLINSIATLKIKTWLAVIIFILIAVFIDTYRWKLLLQECNYLKLVKVSFQASFFNLVLPGQLVAEGTKVFLLKAKNISLERVASSVVVDKIFGIIPVFVSGMIGFCLSDMSFSLEIIFLVGIVGLGLISAFLFIKVPGIYFIVKKVLSIKEVNNRFLLKILKFLNNGIDTWYGYTNSIKLVFIGLLLGGVKQFLSIMSVYVIVQDMQLTVAFKELLWIDSYSTLALLLPISIGGLGIRDGTFISALGLFGVAKEKALTISMVLFFAQIVRGVVGIVIYMMDSSNREDFKKKNLKNSNCS